MADFEHYNIEHPQDQQNDWVSAPNVTRTDKNLIVKDFFTVNDTEVISLKGKKIGVRSIPSAYSAVLTDGYIMVPSVAVAPVITLPLAKLGGIGKVYIIKDISGSAAATTITIQTTSPNTINGETSTTISTNYGFMGLISDGSNWFTS